MCVENADCWHLSICLCAYKWMTAGKWTTGLERWKNVSRSTQVYKREINTSLFLLPSRVSGFCIWHNAARLKVQNWQMFRKLGAKLYYRKLLTFSLLLNKKRCHLGTSREAHQSLSPYSCKKCYQINQIMDHFYICSLWWL